MPSHTLASLSAVFTVCPGELLSFDIQSRRLTANPVASAFLAVVSDPPDRLLSIVTNETLRGGS